MAHYFDSENTKSEEFLININYENKDYKFYSDNSVFSKRELDQGTKLLLDAFVLETKKNEGVKKCLDVGCGWGAIGIISSTLEKDLIFDYTDINARATLLTEKNIKLNNIENANIYVSDCLDEVINKEYDYVITNPPFRAGNSVLFKIFEQSYKVLKKGGQFFVVLRKKQGSKTYVKKILENKYLSNQLLLKAKGYEVYSFTK